MLLAFFLLATLFAAWPAARFVWKWAPANDAPGLFEWVATIGTLSLGIAVGVDWALALAHVFYRGALLACAALLTVGAAVGLRRTRPTGVAVATVSAREPFIAAVTTVPIVGWLAFITWRGTAIFAFASDALAYHLPRALFFVRHHAFGKVDGTDARLRTFPVNYELLLADVIALTGKDDLTFIYGVLSLVLFGCVVAAMAERWWGRGLLTATVTVLLSLGAPTALLASGVHKNDLFLMATILGCVHWTARWAVTGQRPALALAIVSGALAAGIKFSTGVLVIALLPCVYVRLRAARTSGFASGKEIVAWVGSALVAFALLGEASYVYNLFTIGHVVGSFAGTGYNAWEQLWEFPVLSFMRGFSLHDGVWVPWRHDIWGWPAYDPFFPSFGLPASLFLLAVPFGVWRYRKEGRRAERALVSIAVVVTFFATLPVRVPAGPDGLFMGIARYTMFLPPILFLWTAVPLVRELATRRFGLAVPVALAASGVFGFYAFHCATEYQGWNREKLALRWLGQLPPRWLPSFPERAATFVDDHARDDAVVAYDGAYDSWLYPVFGARLSRHVVFLHPDDGPVKIPSNVTWVAVDRWWHCGFGDPEFVDLSRWDRFLHGKPEPKDLVVYQQLLDDPQFKLVYRADSSNQAVFVRVGSENRAQ